MEKNVKNEKGYITTLERELQEAYELQHRLANKLEILFDGMIAEKRLTKLKKEKTNQEDFIEKLWEQIRRREEDISKLTKENEELKEDIRKLAFYEKELEEDIRQVAFNR